MASSQPSSAKGALVPLEGLAKLQPSFGKDGYVTGGNASGIVDGAAAVRRMRGEGREPGALLHFPALDVVDGFLAFGIARQA